MGHLFLSYSRQDAEVADRVEKAVVGPEISVWVDRTGIRGGAQWRSEIVDALDHCDWFVLLLSPHSAESNNVRKELDLAEERRKPVLPLAIEPVAIPNEMAYQLAGLQVIALFPDFNAGIAELRRTIIHGRARRTAADYHAARARGAEPDGARDVNADPINAEMPASVNSPRAGIEKNDSVPAIKPASIAPAALTPWDNLPQKDRDKVSKLIAFLRRGDFARLRVACLSSSAAHADSAPLMQAMREFCAGMLKVKLDISADNRGEINAGLTGALAGLDRHPGLYETYSQILRPGIVDVATVLSSVARSADTRRQIVDSVRAFAASRRDNALVRDLDKFGT